MAHGANQDDFVRGIMAELGQHMDSTHPRSRQRRRPAVSRLHIISLNNNELPDAVSTAGTPVSPMSASSEGRAIGNTAIGIDEPFLKLVKTRAGSPKEKAASMPRSLPRVQQQKGRGSDRKRHLHQTKRKSLERCSPNLKHSQKHSSDMLHVSALSNIAAVTAPASPSYTAIALVIAAAAGMCSDGAVMVQ